MSKLYGTYRPKRLSAPYNLGQVTMNSAYSPSFFLDNMFADYKAAGLTNILDSIIPEDKYTGELVPGVKKLSRLIVAEYNEAYVNGDEFMNSVKNVGAEFQITAFASADEAIAWVKENTSLVEESPGKFKLAEEHTGIMGEIIPASYLIIE